MAQITEFWTIYIGAWGILIGALTLLWAVSVVLKNASIVDPFWGICFLIAGWFYYTQTPNGDPDRKLLLITLVTIWSLRLSLYLLWRNWGKGEDFRYQNFRQHYGAERYWWFSLFQVFWLQATLAWLISSTLLGGQLQGSAISWLDYAGVVVWSIGLLFEAGSDWQLSRFKANSANKGKLLTTGFWRWTRHPNYFGDSACWWGYGLICLSAGGYLSVMGALFMTWLIIRVSGVRILNRSLVKSKPGYEAYMRRTSAFLPWFPKA